MPELIKSVAIVTGPIIILVAVWGAVYAPELILKTPLPLRVVFWGIALLLFVVAVSLNVGGLSWALALTGLIMLIEPAVAYAVSYVTR